MQTYTTAAVHDQADLAPSAPILAHTAAAARRRGLAVAARQVGTVCREMAPAEPRPSEATLAAARTEVADERTAQERVLDRVVDGLMAELGWARTAPTARRR